ncbi:hypothetical protein Taro_051018 [Colocasia esculenta]|uniref:ACT domain-containing protein ACR n=1 Tax=Colocasia esculenta TaxID=4460 RepID=A0A843XFV9_COLES|nr:hypothetical protein [Colocasia esculenta]
MAAPNAVVSSHSSVSSFAARRSGQFPDLGLLPHPAQLEVARISVVRHGSLAAWTGKPQRKMSLSSINSADVLGSFSATSDKGGDSVPVPIVLIDQDSDENSTIVQLSFGDRLGALFDTMKALKHLGLDVTKGTVTTESSVKQTKLFITRLGRKVENPDLLERIRLTIINNLLKYHPESSERLAMGEAFGIKPPEKKIDVDIATHIHVQEDGPKRRAVKWVDLVRSTWIRKGSVSMVGQTAETERIDTLWYNMVLYCTIAGGPHAAIPPNSAASWGCLGVNPEWKLSPVACFLLLQLSAGSCRKKKTGLTQWRDSEGCCTVCYLEHP